MEEVDLLIVNANILTLNSENHRARSLAVKKGKIVGVWAEERPPENVVEITTQTNVLDLEGRTLLPGFIDTHNHILSYGLMQKKVNCSTPPNETISDILKRIEERVNETPLGKWVEGYGYDDTMLAEHRHPTRDDLDKVAPHHPVYIRHISGHLGVVNSKALEIANITDTVVDPQGGHFGRDADGRLNGVLYEPAAMQLVIGHVPAATKAEMIESLRVASEEFIAQGITMNSDAKVGDAYGDDELEAHVEAAKKRINPMRAQLMISEHLLREDGKFGNYTAEELNKEIEEGSAGRAKLDSAKFFQDGSIQGLTGALREPYYNEPNITGDLIYDQQAMQEKMLNLQKRGFRITTHGNGDRAIESILDAYSYVLSKDPIEDHRHRIEHVQTAIPADLDRMKDLGVAGSFFINHVYYWGDRHERLFLGPDRAKRMNPLKDAVDRNLLFTLHSDCPITPISPLFSVWAAVNRITREGKVLGTEQRIDVITALKAMTIDGARLNFDEENSGTIEVGKRADFAVLDADPTSVDPKDIKDISVTETFIDGEIVFKKEDTPVATSER